MKGRTRWYENCAPRVFLIEGSADIHIARRMALSKVAQGYTTIRCTKERNNPSLLKSQLTMLTASKTIWNCLCPCGAAPNARATSPLCFCLGVHRGVTAKKEKNNKRARSARKGNSAPIQISTALPCVAIMLRVLEAWMSCFWRRAQHLQCVGTNTECHNHAQVVSNIHRKTAARNTKMMWHICF